MVNDIEAARGPETVEGRQSDLSLRRKRNHHKILRILALVATLLVLIGLTHRVCLQFVELTNIESNIQMLSYNYVPEDADNSRDASPRFMDSPHFAATSLQLIQFSLYSLHVLL